MANASVNERIELRLDSAPCFGLVEVARSPQIHGDGAKLEEREDFVVVQSPVLKIRRVPGFGTSDAIPRRVEIQIDPTLGRAQERVRRIRSGCKSA